MAQTYTQAGLSPNSVQALPPGHAATAPAHVALQYGEMDWKTYHHGLVQKFESAEDASRPNRERAERDVDYFDNKQWTDKEAAELKKRGQPVICDNRIKGKIRYLQGMEQSRRTDPRALPRTPQHEDDAHSVTDALRSITQTNRYEQTRSKVWGDILKVGWGGVEITAEERPNAPNPQVVLRRCQWDRMFWDPFSSEDDFSDANYLGLVLWMDREEAIRRYGPDAAKVFDETVSISQVGGTFDDKPKITTWVSYDKRYRVRVVQMYHKGDDGTWQFCEFTKGGYLKAGPSPWLDDQGKPEHPYAWRSAYVDRDNNRYGEIRDMIDRQDAINKRASKFLHWVSVRQIFRSEGSLGNQSPREMRMQLAKPDGEVVLAPGKKFGEDLGVIPTGDMAEAQMLLLQNDVATFDQHGPNAAMLGKGPSGASGRAILANQQGGAIESNPIYDTLVDMDHEVFRKSHRRVRQFWTAEEWVRVTDDMKNLRWVGINAPMRDEQTGQPMLDPMTGQPKVQNQVAQLDVDIIIDDSPHVGTLQGEQFKGLVDLSQVGVVFPPKVYIAASDLRNKGELMQMLDEAQQQQTQQDPLKQAANEAELRNMDSKTNLNQANALKSTVQAKAEMVHAGVAMIAAAQPKQPADNVVPFAQ